MAIPAISPLAAKSAAPGKPGNPAGNDQGPADFAAVLAHQHSGNTSSASTPPPPQGSAPTTTGVQEPPPGEAVTPMLPEELAAAAAAGELVADATQLPTVDPQTLGKMLAANGQARGKQPEAPGERGRANALEQISRNPGLGLGLTTAAAGQPTGSLEKPGKHLDKETAAPLVDGALAPTEAPVAAPLTFPAQNERADSKLADADLLLSGSPGGRQPISETTNPSANLAESATPAGAPAQHFSAALATQQATTGAESAKPTPPSVDTALQSPNWGRNFGEGIVWMAKNDQQTAQININPPQLGPVQITLHLNGDQASAVFASPHAEVRQAIQDALPQLRDMLAASGVNLGQADVGSQGSAPGREFAAQQGNQNRYGDENAILSPDTQFAEKSSSQPIQRGRGLVDLFA